MGELPQQAVESSSEEDDTALELALALSRQEVEEVPPPRIAVVELPQQAVESSSEEDDTALELALALSRQEAEEVPPPRTESSVAIESACVASGSQPLRAGRWNRRHGLKS